jgi:hypothetical protein
MLTGPRILTNARYAKDLSSKSSIGRTPLSRIQSGTQEWIDIGRSFEVTEGYFHEKITKFDKLTAKAPGKSLRERWHTETSLYWRSFEYEAEVGATQEIMDGPYFLPLVEESYNGLKDSFQLSDLQIPSRVRLELINLRREEEVARGKSESLKSTLRPAKSQSDKIKKDLQKTRKSIAQMLDLCITGAFGFWVTGGLLLASRSLHEDHSY